MGLEEFKSTNDTASPTDSVGPSTGGVEEFVDDSGDNKEELPGGIVLDNSDDDNAETEVVKVFGGPGTGKTTTMVGNTEIPDFKGILERMIEERDPSEVMLIAYTRAAADEAKRRLVQLTDITQSRADDRVTTIHSLAMSFNSLTPKDIVEIRWSNDKYDFCQNVGMEYKLDGGDDQEDMMAVPDDDGHLFFQIHSWLKSKLKKPEEYRDCPLATSWTRGDEDFVKFANEWEQYKTDNGLWEFDDAIMECVNNEDTVDAKFLFVDEVQDLYPLQQAFLDNQFGHVQRIFMGGDDDQTIYEWAGAKPEYFLDMQGNVNEEMPELWEDKTGYWEDEGVYILDQSWRMPNEILPLAKRTIEKVDERQKKRIKPHHEGGEFIPLKQPTDQTVMNLINTDDTMILFRAKYQMSDFGQSLIGYGIPHETRFKTWSDDVIALRDGLAKIKNGKSIMTGDEAARVVKELPERALDTTYKTSTLVSKLNSRAEVPTSKVLTHVRYDRPENDMMLRRWLQEFTSDDMNYFREQAVRNNLMQGKEHLDPEGVKLETIHGSKGREADTIILSTDTTQSVKENMPDGTMTDAERRLYYVGITRTENRLVMCQGINDDSPTIALDTIFGESWRDNHGWANKSEHDRVDPTSL